MSATGTRATIAAMSDASFRMRWPQIAGVAVTAAVVLSVDLSVGWASALAVVAGALTIFLLSLGQRAGR